MPWVALVVVASTIVAIGSGGSALAQGSGDLASERVRAIRIVGLAAVVLGLIALLVQRHRFRARGNVGVSPFGSSLRTAAGIMFVLAYLAFLVPRRSDTGESGDSGTPTAGRVTINPDAPPTDLRPPSPLPPDAPSGEEEQSEEESPDGRFVFPESPLPTPAASAEEPSAQPSVDGGDLLTLFLLLAIAGTASAIYLGARGRGRPIDDDDLLERDRAEAGIRASMLDLELGSGDPKQRITAAYQRLLLALEDAGAARAPFEAPHEHLSRTLGPLGVRPRPLHTLAELYVEAQFGRRDLTDRDRQAALEALDESLGDLAAATATEPEWSVTLPRPSPGRGRTR